MTTYVSDTHSLLWLFTRPEKLGRDALKAFQEVTNGESDLLIPVIVIAVLIFTVEKKPIHADLNIILDRLEASPNVHFVELELETVKRLRRLDAIPEMHDCIIVAEVIENDAVLITFDKTISASGRVEVVW